MNRFLYLLAAIAAGALWSAPASAQGLNWFYCYAANAKTGTVYVSDVHAIGPVGERASYGPDFAAFLAKSGKAPAGTQAYCVMRGTEREIATGLTNLSRECTTCGGADKFEQVAWPRGGKTLGNLLAGNLPSRKAPDPAGGKPPVKEEARKVEEPGEGLGVFLMARLDDLDVVFTANEDNGGFLTRQKADLRGGKWTTLLQNDRCPGWMAVAYATNGTSRNYFIAKGASSEGAASLEALNKAEDYVTRRGNAEWRTGVLNAFVNDYRAPGLDLSNGVIDGVKGKIRNAVTSDCNDYETASSGVRG